MKILLTGSTGMVGRNILDFTNINHEILAPNRNELDLLNYENVLKYLNHQKPDFVIHCAGTVGGIQANLREPVRFLIENLEIGKNIILAANKIGIKKILNLASSCMYPKNADNPLNVEDILNGRLEPTNEGYALAKITIMKLCEYISKDSSFEYKTIIPCNLYGLYDKFDDKHSHMIPAVIKKIYNAKINNYDEVEIWGSGNVRREFMYCEDLVCFIHYAIENFENLPLIMNVGVGYDLSIKDYYEIIAEVLSYKGKFVFNMNKEEGMKKKLVDISIQKKLGWMPKTSLKTGLDKTINYYIKMLSKNDSTNEKCILK